MTDLDPASLIQSGGVLGLAVLVWFELRALKPLLRSLDLGLQALLERERARTGPIRMRAQSPAVRSLVPGDDEDTEP